MLPLRRIRPFAHVGGRRWLVVIIRFEAGRAIVIVVVIIEHRLRWAAFCRWRNLFDAIEVSDNTESVALGLRPRVPIVRSARRIMVAHYCRSRTRGCTLDLSLVAAFLPRYATRIARCEPPCCCERVAAREARVRKLAVEEIALVDAARSRLILSSPRRKVRPAIARPCLNESTIGEVAVELAWKRAQCWPLRSKQHTSRMGAIGQASRVGARGSGRGGQGYFERACGT